LGGNATKRANLGGQQPSYARHMGPCGCQVAVLAMIQYVSMCQIALSSFSASSQCRRSFVFRFVTCCCFTFCILVAWLLLFILYGGRLRSPAECLKASRGGSAAHRPTGGSREAHTATAQQQLRQRSRKFVIYGTHCANHDFKGRKSAPV